MYYTHRHYYVHKSPSEDWLLLCYKDLHFKSLINEFSVICRGY